MRNRRKTLFRVPIRLEIKAELYSNDDFLQREDIVTDRIGVKVYQ